MSTARRRKPDAPRTSKGIQQGNSTGNYEKMAGHNPDGTSTRRALDRHQRRRRASRSTRGCRTCRRRRRPAAHGGDRGEARRSTSRSPSPAPAPRARGGADAALRAARSTRGGARCARSCSTCRSRSRRAARVRRARATTGCSSCSAPATDWGTTLRTLLWTRTTLVVPPFTGQTDVDLLVPCTYDLEVDRVALPRRAAATARCRSSSCSAARSSTRPTDGRLQTARHRRGTSRPSTACRCAVWRETMDHHFPGSAWLRLDRGVARPARRLQVAARAADVGRRARRAAPGRRSAMTDDPCARSPTPSSTRATSSGPTGARR